MIQFIFVGCALAVGIMPRNPDHWRHQIFLGLLCMGAWLSAQIWKRIHWSASLPFAVALASGLYCAAWKHSPFQAYGDQVINTFDAVIGGSIFYLLLVTIPFLFAGALELEYLIQGFAWLGLLNSLYLIFHWLNGETVLGFLDNPAMDASFIAMTTPALIYRSTLNCLDFENRKGRYWVQLIFDAVCVLAPLIAAGASHSNTGILGLAVGLGAFLFAEYGFKHSTLALSLGAAGALSGVGYWSFGDKFLNSSGRVQLWRDTLSFWWDNVNHWIGKGLGSYFVFGRHIQISANPMLLNQAKIDVVIWAHNDWIQVLFELGIVGTAAVLLLFAFMLARSLKYPWVFSSVVVFGFVALTQMPLHLLPMSVFGSLLIRLAFSEGKAGGLT